MKLIKFKDNTFGVRKGWFPWTWKYLDLDDGYWWPRNSMHFRDCKGTLGQAMYRFDAGEAVSIRRI